jgi:hypothetical protein
LPVTGETASTVLSQESEVRFKSLAMAELGLHEWSRYRCGCGNTATHLPRTFEALFNAVESAETADIHFSGHLEINGALFEVAVPATRVILAALAGDLEPFAQSTLMGTLCHIMSSDAHPTEVALGRTELRNECRYWAREGIWVILQQGFGMQQVDDAIYLLEMVELDERRIEYYTEVLRNRMKRRQIRP